MENKKVFGRNESLVLNSNTFQRIAKSNLENTMTVQGAANKTIILLSIVAVSAAFGWLAIDHTAGFSGSAVWIILAALAALLVAIITGINMSFAPVTAPMYALLEGFALGGISAIFEADYAGIAIQAVSLTFATLFGLLIIYRVSRFHVTGKFRTGVASATLAICLVYSGEILLNLLGLDGIPLLHQGGFIGIAFSLGIVCVAALNLVLDFDIIETGARQGAPKYMEWYSAFALMVTLIWLYLEILKLLIQLYASSDDS